MNKLGWVITSYALMLIGACLAASLVSATEGSMAMKDVPPIAIISVILIVCGIALALRQIKKTAVSTKNNF